MRWLDRLLDGTRGCGSAVLVIRGEAYSTADTYARAEQTFGHEGLVDMVLLIGLYLATCALINVFDSPAPEAIR